jgi:Tol biopolymer transport system component
VAIEGRTTSWSSVRPEIALVDANGVLTAVAEGTTTITASVDGIPGQVQVTVRSLVRAVDRVVVNAADLDLEPGDAVLLTARAEAADGTPLTGRMFMWGSSAPHIVAAEPNGRLRAQSTGAAVITVASEGKQAQFTVTVHAPPANPLAFDRVSASGNELFVRAHDGSLTRLNAGNVSRHPSFSPDGQRVVFAVSQRDLTTNTILHDLFIVDRNGMNPRHLTRMGGIETDPVWSPDGARIAFVGSGEVVGTAHDIYVVNVDGSGVTNLTPNTPMSLETQPAWSPDGGMIAYTSWTVLGTATVHTMRADGSGDMIVSPQPTWSATHPTWSPDGRRIAWAQSFGAAGMDVVILDRATGAFTRLERPGEQVDPVWSPDGRHFAVAGREGETSFVYTMQVDGRVLRRRGEGRHPAWVPH